MAVIGRSNDLNGDYTVFIVDPEGWEQRRLARTISGPSWSPDGTRLAFVGATGDRKDTWDLLTMTPDGTDVRRLTPTSGRAPRYVGGHAILTGLTQYGDGWIPTLAWSPAGDQLLYTCGLRICVVALDGTPVGQSPGAWASGSVAAWSPDGTRIAVAAGAVWQTRGMDARDTPALYSMAPDGSDVRVLAAYDAEGEVRPLGPRPVNVRVDVTECAAGVAVAEPSANPGLVRDCETLLRVQAGWGQKLGWSAEAPIQEWKGVALDGSPPRVRELRIWRQTLGPIPPAVGDLDQLKVLSLSGGVLGGTIPPEVGRLRALQMLDLRGGFVSGMIPAELGELTQLVRLDLAYNHLSGPIPKALGELAALRMLDLSNNELSGTIPSELAQLANLNEVHLGGNYLTGCIPTGLRPTGSHSYRDLGLPRCETGAGESWGRNVALRGR